MMALPSRKVAGTLVAVALRPLIGDAAEGLGKTIKNGPPDSLNRLQKVMLDSQDRAWRALELGLRGPTWWSKATNVLSGDHEMARVQGNVKAFVELLGERESDDPSCPLKNGDFRVECLNELLRARKGGVIPGDPIAPGMFADEMSVFPAVSAGKSMDQPDLVAFKYLSIDLEQRGYGRLASYVEYARPGDEPLLLAAVQHFFRRAIEADEHLLGLIQAQRLERQESTLFRALDKLDSSFSQLGSQITAVFDELHDKVSEVHDDVKKIGSALAGIRLEEQERYERDLADRQLMMAMMQDMAKEIKRLTGKSVGGDLPAGGGDVSSSANEVRQLAKQVIESRDAPSDLGDVGVQRLKELAKRFDFARDRVFGHLHANTVARDPDKAPVSSQGASKVFGVARRNFGGNASRPLNGRKELSLEFVTVPRPQKVDIVVTDSAGKVVRSYCLGDGGNSMSLSLRPGVYFLSIDGISNASLEVNVSSGNNPAERWAV